MRKKCIAAFCIMIFFAQTASAVTIGPAQTKKERNRTQSSSPTRNAAKAPENKVMEAFLKQDHEQVVKLTAPLLTRHHTHPEIDEMVYIRALSLMKLGRIDEARLLLIELERSGLTADIKARAAYSIGDSYYFTTGDTKAYQNALNAYPFYDEADAVRIRIREKQSVQTPATVTPIPRPLQQMGVVEAPLFSVQVGSFSKEKNAKQLVSKLIRKNYDARVIPDTDRDIYRVRIGSFVSRHDALILERKLKKEGYPTKIVP